LIRQKSAIQVVLRSGIHVHLSFGVGRYLSTAPFQTKTRAPLTRHYENREKGEAENRGARMKKDQTNNLI